MFENPRRGRQTRHFTTNVPKILDRKSSSEEIFSENCRWVPLLTYLFCIILLYYAIISTVVSNSALYRLLSYYSWSSCLTKVTKLVNWLLFSGYYYIVQWLLPWRWNFYFKEWSVAFYLSFHFLFLLQVLVASSYEAHFLNKKNNESLGLS